MHTWSNEQFWRQQACRQSLGTESFFQALEQNLPPVFTRKTASEMTGGIISPKTLSNLNAMGKGPPKVKTGSKVAYERATFVQWLRARMDNS